MPSPLTPIGFDIPMPTPTTIRPPQQLAQPDVGGLQTLAQSAQQTQQTIQQQQQNAQAQAQAVADIAKAQSASVQAISQATAQTSQLAASRSANNAQSFNQLGQTILQYTTEYAKQKAATDEVARKARQEAQTNAAVVELENLRVDWIEQGRIDREGTTAYRDRVAETLGKYDVEASEVRTLTQRYYDPALDYAKTTESNRQRSAEEITKQQRSITSQGLLGKISASLGGLRASAGLDQSVVDSHYDNVRGAIGELMATESIPIIDRLTAVNTALTQTNETMLARNVDSAKLNAEIRAFTATTAYAEEQQEKLKAGAITFDEYNASVKVVAMQNNIPGFSVPDPNAGMEYVNRTLSTTNSISELQQKERLSQIQAITAKDEVIGALTTQFILDPTAYYAVKSKDPKELDANAKAALTIADEFVQWRDKEVPAFNASQQRKASTVQGRNADFDRWFVTASRDTAAATQSPSYSKMLEQMRMLVPGIADVQSGKRPLTQEDVDMMQAAYAKENAATQEEASVEARDYAAKQARFAKYGLFLNVNTTKEANKQFGTALQRYNQQLQEANAASTNYKDQPGNSPNFNGGAPGKPKNWKPLALGNYGGKQITFPFAQNVAATLIMEPGHGFNAARSGGRSHNALDFAVPIGTPTQSMVYGSVKAIHRSETGYGISIEVKGDDGYTYHYAHLSKTMVTPGERVGAGQTIALTGDTGTGTGPHLHFDLLDPNGNIVDPLPFLASRKFGDTPRMPRSSGNDNSKVPPQTRLPASAIPLGGNSYLYNGRVISSADPKYAKPVNYTATSPLRNSHATTGDTSPTANHGYSALAKDQAFAKALNAVAKRQGIPGQWLADLISVESAGTFSHDITNPWGYVGLIQFGSAAAQDLGTTQEALSRMPPHKQMVYVEKYLDLQKRYAGVDRFRNVGELVAAVNQGHTVLRDVRARGQAAIEDASNHDGAGVTLKAYLGMLGKFSGRRYDYSRLERASTVTHTRTYAACTTCNALQQQQAFVPHEAQNTA